MAMQKSHMLLNFLKNLRVEALGCRGPTDPHINHLKIKNEEKN